MATRDEVERIVRSAYASRMRGDLDGILGHFAPGAHFSVSGSPGESPVPMVASGEAAIREVMRRLVGAFEFLQSEIVSLIVDGDRAAVHWRVRLRAGPGKPEVETELVDLLQMRDGKILSLKQFADTALASRLLGS